MTIARFLELVGIKRQPPPVDAIFSFKKFYSFAEPYWEASARFAPLAGAVEVLIDCPRSGAAPAQHDFYRQLEARYREVLSAAHQAILKELSTTTSGSGSSWVTAGASPPPAESLRLACISLPTTPPGAEWELSFEDRAGVLYDVAFQGWQPVRVELTPC